MSKRIVPTSSPRFQYGLFWSILVASFLGLLWYRLTFHAPVWVDEMIAKAAIFGFPVILFLRTHHLSSSKIGFSKATFWSGAYRGLAIGGLFGFTAMIASRLHHSSVLIPNLFSSPLFWWTFFLAMVTAWWESLFFYGLVQTVLTKLFNNEVKTLIFTTLIFVVFHAPRLLLMQGVGSIPSLCLLGLFALGQAIVFARTKSLTTIMVSHAFWGMALLVYTL